MKPKMDVRDLRERILKDPILTKLSNLTKERKISFFLVGGYIRDLFLSTHRIDYDFTLPKEASPFLSTIEEAFKIRFFRVGKEETDTITYRTVKKEMSMDITFFQGQTIEEDLQRRDFTINAIAFSLCDVTFHWVKEAFEDIENKVIRTVSDSSIDQDPLRMLRAIRYLCTLEGFVIDPALKEEISLKRVLVAKLPKERIKMELDRIFLSPFPAIGMKSLHELGLLLTLMPELKGLENLDQNEHHHLNVLSHTFLMIEKIFWASKWTALKERNISLTQEDWLSLYYASLFHDLGKQDTYLKNGKGKVHFYDHESHSYKRAEGIMERLRFSNQMKNRILRLIQNHMRILNLSKETKETALKRLVNQMGDETPLLVLHTLADKEASRGILSAEIDDVIEGHCLRVLELFKEKDIVYPSPLLNGHDVMALGYPSGPRVGEILNLILEKQLEGEIKTRDEALRVLKERFG